MRCLRWLRCLCTDCLRSIQRHCKSVPITTHRLHSNTIRQFDDLTAGKPVGNYKSANWTNFKVAKESTGAPFHINAASLPNYGLVPANHIGNMSFTGTFPFGRLYSMHYACAIGITDPSSYVAVPTRCEVTVSAKCQPTISEPDPATETTATYTLKYEPGNGLAANMSYATGFPPKDNGVCTSYAFSAKGLEGHNVDLLVDEVLYNSYNQGFAK